MPIVNCIAYVLGTVQKEAALPTSHLDKRIEWKSKTQVTEMGISELSCKSASGSAKIS